MDMFPHTVTIYNTETEESPENGFSPITYAYITILEGVFLDETKAVNVNKSGLEGADAVNLYIPFSVSAIDGLTGETKTFLPPLVFWSLQDKTGFWTLSFAKNGGDTFFVKGDIVLEDIDEALSHGDAYTITKIDAKDYGGDMAHWEVGGA